MGPLVSAPFDWMSLVPHPLLSKIHPLPSFMDQLGGMEKGLVMNHQVSPKPYASDNDKK